MAPSEGIEADGLLGVCRPSGLSDTSDLAIETLVLRLSELIAAVGSYRPDVSDGIGWVSLDTALCSLHSAVVALEEFAADRARVPAPTVVSSSHRPIGV
jgi:hypothetical protein